MFDQTPESNRMPSLLGKSGITQLTLNRLRLSHKPISLSSSINMLHSGK